MPIVFSEHQWRFFNESISRSRISYFKEYLTQSRAIFESNEKKVAELEKKVAELDDKVKDNKQGIIENTNRIMNHRNGGGGNE